LKIEEFPTRDLDIDLGSGTVVHHSSTSTYIPNFIGIGKTFCVRKDVRTDGHLTHVIRSTLRSRPKKVHQFHGTFPKFGKKYVQKSPLE